MVEESDLVEEEWKYLKLLSESGVDHYNIRLSKDSDNGSFVMEDSQKKLISDSLKEYYTTNDNPFKRKKHSTETREKIKTNLRNPDGSLKADFFSDEYRKRRSEQVKRDGNIKYLLKWKEENCHPKEPNGSHAR
jgi:hypothetical protein